MSSFFQFCYHQHNILSAIQHYGYSCSVTQSMSSTNTCNLHCDDTVAEDYTGLERISPLYCLVDSHRSMYGHPNVLLWSFTRIPNWPQWTTDYLKVSFVNPNAVDNFQILPMSASFVSSDRLICFSSSWLEHPLTKFAAFLHAGSASLAWCLTSRAPLTNMD